MKVYLAGPMRGVPDFNFPAFHAAAARLRAQGHEVFSPAENDIKRFGKDAATGNATGDERQLAEAVGSDVMAVRRRVFEDDLTWICREADAIALLPGWSGSRGARAEKAAAEALGLAIILLPFHG